MTTIAGFNTADLTDYTATEYTKMADQALVEQSKWGIALSTKPDHSRLLVGASSYTLTETAGITGAITSSTPAGSSTAATTPTDSQVTISWAQMVKYVEMDQASLAASFIDLVQNSAEDILACYAQTWDYHAATAAVASTTSGTFEYVGQTARASITTSDILTLAYARKAHAKLVKANAPTFNIPPFGQCYLAMVHPDVAYDLKQESSGIFTGAQNVHTPTFQANILGYESGFVWIESGATPLIRTDGGVSTCDVYNTVFMGNNALAMAHAPVKDQPGCDSQKLNAAGSCIARRAYPGTNLGVVQAVGLIMNIGFGLAKPSATYRVESASSIGTNT